MKEGRFRVLALVAADLVTIYGAWVFALWGYRAIGFGHYKFGFEFYLKLWPVGAAFVLLNVLFRLYHGLPLYPGAPVPPHEELRRLVGSALFTHLGLIAFLAFARQTTVDYSRVAMAAAGVITAVSAQTVRDVIRRLLHRVGWGLIPVRVVGDPVRVAKVSEAYAADAYTGFRPVAGAAEESEILVMANGSDEAARTFADSANSFTFVERVSGGGLMSVEYVNQRRMPALRAEKRMLDFVLAVFAFVVALPFFIVLPVLIKLTSRGSVFYRQDRLGKSGRPIRVWKFRSMYADADTRLARLLAANSALRTEWERNFKLSDDPRVTPLGRFMRRTSLDELPQLFNVFAGDMALVGPRPIVRDEVAFYGDSYPVFASVRPGVTGLWQVSGRSAIGYDERVELDTRYVLNWSPWLDFWILKRTFAAVLMMRGAC